MRLEAEGAGAAFEGYVVVGVDEIDAVGPARVGLLGGVAEFVEHGREFDAQFADAGSGDRRALGFIFRTGQDDLIADVGFHLPDVTGVRFEDVDN